MADIGSYLLAEVMLWLMYAVAAVAVVVTIVSAVRPFVIAPKERRSGRGWVVAACVAVLLVLTYLLGSDQPLVINGTAFTDAFWLKVTDMLILSSIVLIVVATCFVLYGVSGLNRKLTSRHSQSVTRK